MAADYQRITLRLPEEILDKARDVAHEESRSLNEQLLYILKVWYREEMRREKADAVRV
jgi:hypothetical protein